MIDDFLLLAHLVAKRYLLFVQRDEVVHGFLAVVVGVLLIAEDFIGNGLALLVERVAQHVVDGAVLILLPDVTDG